MTSEPWPSQKDGEARQAGLRDSHHPFSFWSPNLKIRMYLIPFPFDFMWSFFKILFTLHFKESLRKQGELETWVRIGLSSHFENYYGMILITKKQSLFVIRLKRKKVISLHNEMLIKLKNFEYAFSLKKSWLFCAALSTQHCNIEVTGQGMTPSAHKPLAVSSAEGLGERIYLIPFLRWQIPTFVFNFVDYVIMLSAGEGGCIRDKVE